MTSHTPATRAERSVFSRTSQPAAPHTPDGALSALTQGQAEMAPPAPPGWRGGGLYDQNSAFTSSGAGSTGFYRVGSTGAPTTTAEERVQHTGAKVETLNVLFGIT